MHELIQLNTQHMKRKSEMNEHASLFTSFSFTCFVSFQLIITQALESTSQGSSPTNQGSSILSFFLGYSYTFTY